MGALGALFAGQQAGEQLRGVGSAGVAQWHDLQRLVAHLVELAQQAVDAFKVAAPVGHYQQVGCRIRRDHPDPGVDQRLEDAKHLLAGSIAHIEHPGGHAVTACARFANGFDRHRLQARSLVGDDLDAAVGQVDSRVALGTQLGEKDVVDGIGVVAVDGAHGDLALDPRVDDEGGAGDARHAVDELAQLGVDEVHLVQRCAAFIEGFRLFCPGERQAQAQGCGHAVSGKHHSSLPLEAGHDRAWRPGQAFAPPLVVENQAIGIDVLQYDARCQALTAAEGANLLAIAQHHHAGRQRLGLEAPEVLQRQAGDGNRAVIDRWLPVTDQQAR